jgi:hypothetical protein
MRTSRPTMILSLAAALTWLGWMALPAEAGAPDTYQASDGFVPTGDGEGPAEGTCEQPPCSKLGTLVDRFFHTDDCGPRWTVTAEGIALQRSSTRSQLLFREQDQTTDAKNVGFPVQFGPQVSAIHHGDCGWDVEVAYFQVDDFDIRTTASGPSFMVTDNAGTGFLVTDAGARYRSALYSGEINVRRCVTEWLTVLAGFRMLELNERYNAEGIGQNSPVLDTLDINTFNHLYGFQIGADAEAYNMGGPLLINVLCKAGIYGNFASQNSRRIDTGFSDESVSAERHQATFMGEAGVVATYALTKRLALRASAQAIWLEGVALAPEQIGANDFFGQTAYADTHGGVFYYGGGAGVEYRF